MNSLETRNELIPIESDNYGTIRVSGRELHQFLEVGTAYDVRIKRMIEYGFTEDLDFSSFLMESSGGRPRTDHVLTIEMAKEISMLQRNEKGKQARLYFIELEKEFNSPEKVMARALKIADESIRTLTTENKIQAQMIGELKPKADYTDKILKSKSLVTITAIAKDYGMSGTKFNRLLKELKIQYKQGSQRLLYANYQSSGYTHSETVDFKRKDGTTDVNMITKRTQKGRLFLYNTLKKNGYLPTIEQDDED